MTPAGKRLFWACASIGILLRMGLFFLTAKDPARRFYATDSFDYQRLAVNLLAGHGFSRDGHAPFRPDALRTPAYPALLALLYRLSGPNPAVGVFAGVLLSCVAIFLARRAARAWIPGTGAGDLAGAFVVLDLGAAAYANFLLTESLFVVLLLWAFERLGRAVEADGGRDGFVSGFFLGLAILCCPIALGLPLLSLLARSWKVSRLVLLGSAIVVTPWVARNVIAVGIFDVSSVGSVNLLYHRASAVEDARLGRPHETAATPADASDEAAVARMRREGLRVLERNAGLFVRLTLFALLRTFGPDEDPLFQLLGISIDPSPWWLSRSAASRQPRALSLGENLAEGAFLLALLAGVIRGLFAFGDRLRRPLLLGAGGVVIYFLLVSGPEYYGRFRVPILPFLALIADAGRPPEASSAGTP